jgi:hypothetical protein
MSTPYGVALDDVQITETEWLIPGVITADGPNLIVGKPKAGKSQFALGVVASIITGQPLGGLDTLTPPPTSPAKVMWVGTDGGWKRSLKKRREGYPDQVGRHLTVFDQDLAQTGLLFTSTNREVVQQTVDRWLKIGQELIDDGYRVIVFDHLLGLAGGVGLNDDTTVAPLMQMLTRLADLGLTPITVHHASIHTDRRLEEAPMGHTAVTATHRCQLIVREGTHQGDYQEVWVRSNETEETCLVVDPLKGGPLKVQQFLPRADRAESKKAARKASETDGTRRKRKRSDLGIARAKAVLEAPAEHRANQRKAGEYLESLGAEVMRDATNGYELVRNLIKSGLLAADNGAVVAGSKWVTGQAA